MLIEAIVRDGGTKKQNYQTKIWHQIPRTKTIEIPFMADNEITDYFKKRANELLMYLNKDIMPPMCNSQENWNNRRCRGYCDLFTFCPEGRKLNKLVD